MALQRENWQNTVALIANAPVSDYASLKLKITSFSQKIAVDGGANHCYAMDIKPDLIIGDFDSIDPAVLKFYSDVPQKKFPAEKDQTDIELALLEVEWETVRKASLFCATEGRIDHTLGNLFLLARYPQKLILETDTQECFVIDKKIQLSTFPGQTLSLIPLNGPVTGIYSKGLKWELNNSTLDKHFIGISNVATGSTTQISINAGDLLCCISIREGYPLHPLHTSYVEIQ